MDGIGTARPSTARVRHAIGGLAMAALLAGCSATASGTPTASPTAAPSATPSPAVTTTPSAAATPSPVPTATLVASPAPSFPPAGWSAPQAVGPAVACAAYAEAPVSLVIDPAGGDHAAYACDGLIRLADSADAGRHWTTTSVPLPAGEKDLKPQLAADGTLLYLAYERVAPAEGCGSTGATDLSVRYRTRALGGGAWSAPRAVGDAGDELDALRVVGGTLHVAVHADAAMAYVTLHGATYHRYPIAVHTDGAGASLRVGDDGKARVAYEDSDLPADQSQIRYGVFTGSGFSTSAIPGSDEGWDPQVVLGAGDTAYVLWQRSPQPGGCVTREAEAADGTYFATNAGGAWSTTRLTSLAGDASLTVDPATGTVDVVVSGSDEYDVPSVEGFLFLTRSPDGAWGTTTLSATEVDAPVIRLDPVTGAALVAYTTFEQDGSTAQVDVTTRP